MKKLCLWMLACLLALLPAAVAQEDAEALALRCREANTAEALLSRYGCAAFSRTDVDENGVSAGNGWYLYLDADTTALQGPDGSVTVLSPEGDLSYDAAADLVSRCVYAEPEARQQFAAALAEMLHPDADGIVQGAEEKDGVLCVTSVLDDPEEMYDVAGPLWSRVREGDVWVEEAFYDAGSLELSGIDCYLQHTDGTREICRRAVLLPEVEEPFAPDPALAARLEGTDTRELRWYLDPGTEQEALVSAKVPKGCGFRMIGGERYDGVYTDLGCTEMYDPEADDRTGDLLLYSAAAEEAGFEY